MLPCCQLSNQCYLACMAKIKNPEMTNFENWTNEKWVAKYLNLKPNTLRKQRSVGVNFIPYSKFGGAVRYNKLTVMEWAEAHSKKPKDNL